MDNEFQRVALLGSTKRNQQRLNKKRPFHSQLIYSLQPGAGTMSPEIISSLMTGGSEGGGGHTKLSMMSSVARRIPARSGGSVLDDRIIIHKANSSWSTLSKYIMSRSDTMAPFITMISSPFIIPAGEDRTDRNWTRTRPPSTCLFKWV